MCAQSCLEIVALGGGGKANNAKPGFCYLDSGFLKGWRFKIMYKQFAEITDFSAET